MKFLFLLFMVSSVMAASSETIFPPTDPRTVYCQTAFEDHIFIAQVVAGGTPRTKFEAFAKASPKLTAEHLAEVLKLINEAYTARDVTVWLNSYWMPCMTQEDI